MDTRQRITCEGSMGTSGVDGNFVIQSQLVSRSPDRSFQQSGSATNPDGGIAMIKLLAIITVALAILAGAVIEFSVVSQEVVACEGNGC